MNFSEKLKMICLESGLSLKKISELSDIPYSSLRQYSQGKRKPKIEKIQKLASLPELENWKEHLLGTEAVFAQSESVDPNSFSEKLKVVCSESGLTIRKISELSGISYSTLKGYSQGQKRPKIDKIQKIASVPALEPWKEFLLDQSELTHEDSELLIEIARWRRDGRTDELLEILRERGIHVNDE